MSEPLFKTCKISDARISTITDSLVYAVQSGPSSTNYQQFVANSAGASQMVFQLQIPSESVVINREFLIDTGLQFTLNIGNAAPFVPAGVSAFNYGVTDAFQAFPLNSLFTTVTSTINNSTVSINLQDVLPSLLRLNNSRELYRYNGMTPTLPDQAYYNFSDAVDTNNNPLAAFGNSSYDNDQLPRGAFQLQSISIARYTTAGGTVAVDSSPIALGQAAAPGERWVVVIMAHVTEPLMLPPYIFGNPEYNQSGFVGVNVINLVCNIDSTAKRMWSTASPYSYSIALGISNNATPFIAPRLLMNYMSIQPSDLISTRCVIPYMEIPRYITTPSTTINAAVFTPASISGLGAVIPASLVSSTVNLTATNIQINQIPDFFIVQCRIPMVNQTIKNASAFLPITSISVNFNNVSGLLSSASPQDLWKLSVRNGSTQNWEEFSGVTMKSNSATGVGSPVPTIGSLLLINPARDLSLSDWLAPGSIGQFNIQFNLTVQNYSNVSFAPEIVLIAVNSGIFCTEMGSSNTYTGILSKELVLDAKSQQAESAITSVQHKRMVGGSFNNMSMSALKHMIKEKHKKMEMMAPSEKLSRGGRDHLSKYL